MALMVRISAARQVARWFALIAPVVVLLQFLVVRLVTPLPSWALDSAAIVSDVIFPLALMVSFVLIYIETRAYLRPAGWRWRRAVVFVCLIVGLAVIGGLLVAASVIESGCVGSQSQAVCDARRATLVAFAFVAPMAVLTWGLPVIFARERR